MRITSKGQVTIPQEVRERFGLLPDTEVDFVIKRNVVHLVKAQGRKRPTRGETIVRRLRGSATVKMTTDEILSLTRK
jgi:AbrB family looped-hinge helix DNA binding protein